MGYRIWRKDKNVWSLAFDTIYETQDKVTDAIAELKAAYHELMKYGDVEFLPYPDNINISKNGNIVENTPYRKPNRPAKHNRSYKPSTQLSNHK
jgi:hypothetical protein